MDILKKLLNLLTFSPEDVFPGAILDEDETLAGLPTLGEVVSEPQKVVWKELDLSKIPEYPVRNQDGSSSCVAFSLALIGSILYFLRTNTWINFSASWIYHQRSNKPAQGMIASNAFEIASKGMLPDELMPSDNLSEEAISATRVFAWFNKIAEVFGLDTRFVILPIKDIETLASTVQATNKPVMVWFEFGSGEWGRAPRILSNFAPWRHSTVALCPSKPNEMTFGIFEGEKAIVIQDSWGKDLETIGGKRVIKESFYNKRNIFAAYPRRFKFDISSDTPVFDGSIKSAQKCLQTVGYFPLDVPFVENVGPITREAIKKFQGGNGLAVDGTLNEETKSLLKIKFN